MKPVIMWVGYYEKAGLIDKCSLFFSRKETIEYFISLNRYTDFKERCNWSWWYRRGWRAAKVEVRLLDE